MPKWMIVLFAVASSDSTTNSLSTTTCPHCLVAETEVDFSIGQDKYVLIISDSMGVVRAPCECMST